MVPLLKISSFVRKTFTAYCGPRVFVDSSNIHAGDCRCLAAGPGHRNLADGATTQAARQGSEQIKSRN